MTETGEARREGGRYSTVSIILHWMLVVLILTQVWIGSTFDDLPRGTPDKDLFRMLHFSTGFTILALSLIRLVWRLAHPAPPLPNHMPLWEKVVARANHAGFYLFMIGMPLTGWLMISAGGGSGRPLELWGFVPWFRIPGVPDAWADVFERAHVDVFLKAFWVLLFLHVAGALRHHFLQKDEVLWRMLPIVPRPRNAR